MTKKTKSQKLEELLTEYYEEELCGSCEEDEENSEWQECDDCETFEDSLPRGHNKSIGRKGEDAAVRYLEHQGYEILERNWTCPAGEADIIAIDMDTLVFIEVKTRISIEKGLPEEAITPKKRSRYERIALYYLRSQTLPEMRVRFDVIGMTVYSDRSALLRHHVNAFGVE